MENLDKVFTVYKHTFPNGKVYIGITSVSVEKRWKSGHGYIGQVIENAIVKYGWKNIKHEIIETGLTQEEAEHSEIALIAFYDSTNRAHGYNTAMGGNHRGKVSEEMKQKISKKNKGKKRTPEQNEANRKRLIKIYKERPELRERISKAMIERAKDPEFRARLKLINKGRKHTVSDETRRKISESNKGRKVTEETRRKISAANIARGPEWRAKLAENARNMTAETKAKISKSLTGKKQSAETKKKRADKLRGRKQSAEAILHMTQAQRNRSQEWEEKRLAAVRKRFFKPVCKVAPSGEVLAVYGSVTEAAKVNGLRISPVARVCRGERKTYKGFIWKYKEDDLCQKN